MILAVTETTFQQVALYCLVAAIVVIAIAACVIRDKND